MIGSRPFRILHLLNVRPSHLPASPSSFWHHPLQAPARPCLSMGSAIFRTGESLHARIRIGWKSATWSLVCPMIAQLVAAMRRVNCRADICGFAFWVPDMFLDFERKRRNRYIRRLPERRCILMGKYFRTVMAFFVYGNTVSCTWNTADDKFLLLLVGASARVSRRRSRMQHGASAPRWGCSQRVGGQPLRIVTQIAALRRNRHSIRAYVGAIATLILVPALIVAAWLATLWAASERAQLEQAAEHKVREIAADIDREIVNTQDMLMVLASCIFCRTDLESFHAAATLTRRFEVRSSCLTTVSLGRWSIPSTVGNPLPSVPVNPAADELRCCGSETLPSQCLLRAADRSAVVAVTVPLLRDGAVECALSVGWPLEKFAGFHTRHRSDRIATVLDRRGVVVARSAQHSVCRPCSHLRSSGRPHGVVKVRTIRVSSSIGSSGSEATGWSVPSACRIACSWR